MSLDRKISTGLFFCPYCRDYTEHIRKLGEMGRGVCVKCGFEKEK